MKARHELAGEVISAIILITATVVIVAMLLTMQLKKNCKHIYSQICQWHVSPITSQKVHYEH